MLLASSIATVMMLSAYKNSEETEEENKDATNDNDVEDYGEEINYTITGIEPGAGITLATDKAIEEYDNLEGWTQEESSTEAMTAELKKEIKNEETNDIKGWVT